MELRRVANDDWPLSSIDFDPQIAPPANLALVTNTGGGAGETPLEYVVTAILATNGEESLISNILTVTGNDFAAAGDRVAIDWDTVTGAASYNVYKKRGGIFGFIGNVTTDTFIDNNIVPNIGLAPQQANNPFDGSANPRTTFIYQQRRGFGATATKPNTLWLSQTGRLADFKRSVPARADDSIEFALAGKRVQTIRHVLDIEDLALFTHTSEWRVAAGTSGISATAPPFTRPQSDYGSGELPPLLVGSSLLYVQRGGKDVYRFDYSNDFNRYVSENLNILARHLLGRNTSLVDWSYSQVPHSLVYGMRNDGLGVHMTYNREQQIYAWGTNETAGSYESTCTINELGFDVTYYVVRRRINGVYKRFIEVQDLREFEDIRGAYFVDCGLTYNEPVDIEGFVPSTGVVTITGHGLSTSDPIYIDPPTGVPEMTGRYRVAVIDPDTFTLTTFYEEDAIDTTGWGDYIEGGEIREMFTTFGGLDHLIGENVVGLADGYVVGVGSGNELTVEDAGGGAGQITLQEPAAWVHLGLGYSAHIVTLELDRANDTKQGAKKTSSHANIRVQDTRGIKVGTRASNLIQLKELPPSTGDWLAPPELVTDMIRTSLPTGWTNDHQLMIQQPFPLPMTVLSCIPEIQYGK
jgi:hypothetical protein